MQGQMNIYDFIPAEREIINAKCCDSCQYFGQVVDAYTLERLGFRACCKYEAWSINMNKNNGQNCTFWENKEVNL